MTFFSETSPQKELTGREKGCRVKNRNGGLKLFNTSAICTIYLHVKSFGSSNCSKHQISKAQIKTYMKVATKKAVFKPQTAPNFMPPRIIASL